MTNYLPASKKTSEIQRQINEALDILDQAGIPLAGKSSRSLEKMAMAFLAVAGVTDSWQDATSASENRRLKTVSSIKKCNKS